MVKLRIREPFGAILGQFWKPLGLSWGSLGAILGLSQGALRGLEHLLGATLEAISENNRGPNASPWSGADK